MKLILAMSAAVLIWSLYPLGVATGLQSMSSVEMILIVYIIAGFGATALTLGYLAKNKLIKPALEIRKTLDRKAYIIIITSGIVGVLCHAFFIFALTLANKGGVSLLYESWPVLAIIATPFLMKKTWKEVSLREFMVSLIALVGVGVIILSDEKIGFSFGKDDLLKADFTAIGGYILAFAGAYMLALVVITKAAFSEYFEGLNDTLGATLIGEMLSRILCVIVILTLFVTFNIKVTESNIDWAACFFIGFVVFVLGGALYTYALLLSTSPTIHVLNYFVPVLAVIWLWLAGEATVNTGLFIGGGIVTLCNIYLLVVGRKAKFSEDL